MNANFAEIPVMKNPFLRWGMFDVRCNSEKSMSGKDAFNYLYRTGATDFIRRCYELFADVLAKILGVDK